MEFFVPSLGVLLVGLGAACSLAAESPKSNARSPVIVELFTSEGCSSCPPADELLVRLDSTQPIASAEVIALSEHVDYWNRLGWEDPFSSAAFSARQLKYADSLRVDGPYTPQMVVDGQWQLVGSRSGQAADAITRAAGARKGKVALKTAHKAGSVQINIRVTDLPPAAAGDTAEVIVALTESDLHSSVKEGENAGRNLRHTGVVREMRVVGTATTAQFDAAAVVPIAPGWVGENLRAVVFVQERNSRRVLAAGAITLAAAAS